jgi:signal transduction histidine kinase
VARDGPERPIADSGAPIRDQEGRLHGVVLVFRDMTEERRAETDRLRAIELHAENRQIHEANRLKSEFLANMSHELRTPLNSIIGFAELLQDGNFAGPLQAKQKDFVDDIERSGRHLLQLINDVLDLSKVEAGKMEFRPVRIVTVDVVAEVVAIVRGSAAARRIHIATHVDDRVPELIIDPLRLKQILFNYLSNAIKFTPEDGRIEVRVTPEESHRFRIEVEDTGIGIAPADLERLFAEFHQLDSGDGKKYGGTGLGLALTKRLVETQAGTVGVRSIVGKGSVFFATLPCRATS